MNPLLFVLHMGFRSPDLQPTPFPYLPFNWNKREFRPSASQKVARSISSRTVAGHRFGIFRYHQLRIRRQPIKSGPDPLPDVFPVEVVDSLILCTSKILHKEANVDQLGLESTVVVVGDLHEATGVNGMSQTMLDIIEYSSVAREDFSRSLEIPQILMDAGLIRRENNENDNPGRVKKKKKLHKRVASSENGSTPARRCWIKFMKCLRYPSNWVVETRGMLMVVATMISTMTFQAIVNPPGGVWETNNTNTTIYNRTICSEERTCIAGTAVLGSIWGEDFVAFVNYNTISFLASLSVTLLLVSGFPLHNRLCMWLLSMSMCITLTFMASTYLQVLLMIVPPPFDFSYSRVYANSSLSVYRYSVYVWYGLLAIVVVIHTIRFLIWVAKWLRRMYLRSKSCLKNTITTGSFSCNDPMRFEEIDSPEVV
ncbi:hypothetical protein ACFX13_010509 [Malus domestica]